MSPPRTAADGLLRTMRTPALVVHYVTSAMGVGVLILPGIAVTIAGPASLVAWVILVAWSYPFALVFARMSVELPSAGGIADFVQAAFGRIWGRRTALFLLLTLVIANPLLGLAAGRYLAAVVAPGADNRSVLLIGFLVILAAIGTNVLGVRLGSRLQGTLLVALVTFLIVVIAVALPHGDSARLTPVAPDGWTTLDPALLVCFFGFIGWENAAPVAEEVVDPRRTFPKAIPRSAQSWRTASGRARPRWASWSPSSCWLSPPTPGAWVPPGWSTPSPARACCRPG